MPGTAGGASCGLGRASSANRLGKPTRKTDSNRPTRLSKPARKTFRVVDSEVHRVVDSVAFRVVDSEAFRVVDSEAFPFIDSEAFRVVDSEALTRSGPAGRRCCCCPPSPSRCGPPPNPPRGSMILCMIYNIFEAPKTSYNILYERWSCRRFGAPRLCDRNDCARCIMSKMFKTRIV